MFKWLSSERPAPEALELEEKLRQLDELEEQYAGVFTEYATLQNELAAFKLRYWRRLGPLYSRLDVLRAEIATELARQAPRNPIRQQAARTAGAQAKASADALHEAEEDDSGEEFLASDELKRLYRQAARLVHPDRADDEDDRSLRDEIMARINAAYRNGNGLVIESLIEEYQMRTEVGEEDAATRLIRTIRTISRMREQMRETLASTQALRESELFRLQNVVLEGDARGSDKLAELARGVELQISEAELRLKRIREHAARGAADLEPAPSARVAQRAAREREAAAEPAITRPADCFIAKQLQSLGVAFRYRAAIAALVDESVRTPDFTLSDADGKPLLWFHLPAFANSDERAQWRGDLARYLANGFEIGINLFLTNELSPGEVDETRLSKMAAFIQSQT